MAHQGCCSQSPATEYKKHSPLPINGQKPKPTKHEMPREVSKWHQGQGNTPDTQNSSQSIEKNACTIIITWQNTPYDDQWFLKENANEGYNQMGRETY